MTEYDFDKLGRDISDLVQKAADSLEFSTLSSTIQDIVQDAMTDAAKSLQREINKQTGRAQDRRPDYMKNPSHRVEPAQNPWKGNGQFEQKTADYMSARDIPENELFSTSGVSRSSGYLKLIFGIIGMLACFGGLLSVSIVGAVVDTAFIAAKVLLGAGLAGCAFLTWKGSGILKKLSHFKKYVKALRKRTDMPVKELAGVVGKSDKDTLKELKKMIDENMFLQGHIDPKNETLFVTDQAYEEYIENLQQQERQKAEVEAQHILNLKKEQEEKLEKEKKEAGIPEDVKKMIAEGNAYIQKIRSCNDAIADEEVSRKLDDMELITTRIFEFVSENPESVKETRKLLKYYLPTTIRLLEAYQELDEQPKETENILKSKKEIEATLDTLNQAFAKIFDNLYQDTSMDINADISVLNTMLAQEGLTEQPMGSH
ncbi:MAG: 5-bromo-4-chloroindolyl phosphate hydrolysis family protein [Muricoprocola sp.]